MNWRAAVVLGWVLAIGAAAAYAQDLARPMLLVAKPALKGAYAHTVLLAVPKGDHHVGLILNRSTGQRMASVFPDHAPSKQVEAPIYFGGPEAADALFAVLRRDPGSASLHLFGDLYMTGNAGTIDAIIERTPNDARYFAGFVGWRARELEAEVRRGFWYVDDADAAEVFRDDAGEAMWQEHSQRLGKLPPRQEAAAGAASVLVTH
jgi:putative transcriptional regulator